MDQFFAAIDSQSGKRQPVTHHYQKSVPVLLAS
jgi:hypothetical protein